MVNAFGGAVKGGNPLRLRSDGLRGGVGGYVMVLGGEGLGGEGELESREGGWGVVLVEMCRDLRGRGGIGVWCCGVKLGSLQ